MKIFEKGECVRITFDKDSLNMASIPENLAGKLGTVISHWGGSDNIYDVRVAGDRTAWCYNVTQLNKINFWDKIGLWIAKKL